MSASHKPFVPANPGLLSLLHGNGSLLTDAGGEKLTEIFKDKKKGIYSYTFQGRPYRVIKGKNGTYVICPSAVGSTTNITPGTGGLSKLFYAQEISSKKYYVVKKSLSSGIRYEKEHKVLMEFKKADPVILMKKHNKEPNLVESYLIMELEKEVDLWTFLEKQDLNIFYLIEICIKILEAYQNLHDQNYLHLDPKPENIMINPATSEVTLIDFTSAQRIGKPRSVFIYSPDYLAPELFKKESTETHLENIPSLTSEVYSIGLILRRILRGDYVHFEKKQTNSPKKIREVRLGEVYNNRGYRLFPLKSDRGHFLLAGHLNDLTNEENPADRPTLQESIKFFNEFYQSLTTQKIYGSLVQANTALKKQFTEEYTARDKKTAEHLRLKTLDLKAVETAHLAYTHYKNQYAGLRWLSTSRTSTEVAKLLKKDTTTASDRFSIAKYFILKNKNRAFAKKLAESPLLAQDPEIIALFKTKSLFKLR